jgi:hypothetical protein
MQFIHNKLINKTSLLDYNIWRAQCKNTVALVLVKVFFTVSFLLVEAQLCGSSD